MTRDLLLLAAGVGAGITGTVAGLASLVSYPALLALGLPPLAANVTNTTAMTSVVLGTAAGARTELRGLGRRLLMLSVCCAAGAVLGTALLLRLPASTFASVVPWLVALGSLLLLLRDKARAWAEKLRIRRHPASGTGRWPWAVAVAATGVYAAYFGAAAGIIMLSILSLRYAEAFPVLNAAKTIVTGAGNVVAMVVYVIVAPVNWSAALILGAGIVVGGWVGPQIVRHLPEQPLRYVIAGAGFGLAAWLALT